MQQKVQSEVQRPPHLFDIPPMERAAKCSSCGAAVYWIVTARGKKMPVDPAVPGGQVPSPLKDGAPGRGVSHFATCPHADQHRRPR